jgi:hypothetical protein
MPYIAYLKREHTEIMEYYNLDCKSLQYRRPKKQNSLLNDLKPESYNRNKKYM